MSCKKDYSVENPKFMVSTYTSEHNHPLVINHGERTPIVKKTVTPIVKEESNIETNVMHNLVKMYGRSVLKIMEVTGMDHSLCLSRIRKLDFAIKKQIITDPELIRVMKIKLKPGP